MAYTYEYPRASITTDALLLGFDEKINRLQILLIQRKNEPFMNKWALPGGFLDMDETLEKCAERELFEETGLENIKMEQLITASNLGRDPRGRTVSTIFWTLIKTDYNIKGTDDAKDAKWFSINELPELAFDHNEIISYAIKKLKLFVDNYKIFFEFFNQIEIKNVENLKNILNNLK